MKCQAVDAKGEYKEIDIVRVGGGAAKMTLPDGTIYFVMRSQVMQALVGILRPTPKKARHV